MDMELYGLRIFCQVMVDRTFSQAAKSLKLTQPTVSQQIAKLEAVMGTRLFERVGHDVIPTPVAKKLYQFAVNLLGQVDEFAQAHLEQQTLPKGKVRYAMPESCQWTPHFRKIMGQISKLPEIQFDVEILPNDLIVKGLLEATLDFGFIVGGKLTPELRYERFSDEKYSAVAARSEHLSPFSRSKPEDLRLITYPGGEPYLETWSKAHGFKRGLSGAVVKVGTLAGAIHAVEEGAGVSVIPTHCVSDLLQKKKLFTWESKKSVEASSPIYLARRVGDRHPKRVEIVLEMLRKAKSDEISSAVGS